MGLCLSRSTASLHSSACFGHEVCIAYKYYLLPTPGLAAPGRDDFPVNFHTTSTSRIWEPNQVPDQVSFRPYLPLHTLTCSYYLYQTPTGPAATFCCESCRCTKRLGTSGIFTPHPVRALVWRGLAAEPMEARLSWFGSKSGSSGYQLSRANCLPNLPYSPRLPT